MAVELINLVKAYTVERTNGIKARGGGGGGGLPIMAYTGRLRPKGLPFSGFRYIKG